MLVGNIMFFDIEMDKYLIVITLTFIFSWLIIYLLTIFSHRIKILDHPNERSLHSMPIPRTGGLAIFLAVLFGVLVITFEYEMKPLIYYFLIGGGVVMLVSFIDDCINLNAGIRLAAHILATFPIIYGGILFDSTHVTGIQWALPTSISIVLSVVLIVWLINLYNFMDGIDGLAAGMVIFGFSTFALFGGMAGNELFTVFNLIIVAATLGFLIFNFPPARIFMGDVGSSTLGFFAAGFLLWGSKDGIFPFWIGVLILSPFIIDATVTLIRRLFRGDKIWQAHKTHYYQRIAQRWGHKKTVLLEYSIMLGCSLSAILIIDLSVFTQMIVIAIWGLFYTGFFSWISRLDANHSPEQQTLSWKHKQ